MGCGLNENVKNYLSSNKQDYLCALESGFSEMHFEVNRKTRTLLISELKRISQLMYVLNNTEIEILIVQKLDLPTSALFLALPNLRRLEVDGCDVVRSYCAVDFVRLLCEEFKCDAIAIEQFLGDVYGVNPYFQLQRLVHRTCVSGLGLSSFLLLSYFASIRVLAVSDTPFSDSDALAVDCCLTSLEARHTKITSLDSLGRFQRLQVLDLSDCNLSSWTDATRVAPRSTPLLVPAPGVLKEQILLKLQVLRLQNCKLRSLRFLSQLGSVKRLFIDCNQEIDDFSPVFAMPRLHFLSCAECARAPIGLDQQQLEHELARHRKLQVVILAKTLTDHLFMRLACDVRNLDLDDMSCDAFFDEISQFCVLQQLTLRGNAALRADDARAALPRTVVKCADII